MPDKLKHSPGELTTSRSDKDSEVLRSLGWTEIRILDVQGRSIATLACRSQDIEEISATADLFTIARTAPHDCADPTCPGDVNRRKLKAFEKMRELLIPLWPPEYDTWEILKQIRAMFSEVRRC